MCSNAPASGKRKRDDDLASKFVTVERMSASSEEYQMEHNGGCVIRMCWQPRYCYACHDTAAWLMDTMKTEWPVCTHCAHDRVQDYAQG